MVRASFWKLYSLFYSTSKLSVDVESVVRESYIKVTIYLSPFYFENKNGFRELDSTLDLKEGEIFFEMDTDLSSLMGVLTVDIPSTEWNYRNFPPTLILGEINFADFRGSF